jgi:uncharacterized protein (TIGR02611 family)
MVDWTLKKLKRFFVAVIGMTILFIGIAMIVLPGPAIVVIPIALGILATEFAWARKALQTVRARIRRATNSCKQKPAKEKNI